MCGLPDPLRGALADAAHAPRLLVGSDFDGTLAEIVNHPADARLLPEASAALRSLADLPATTVVLISGRSRSGLATLPGIPDTLHLIGSHGAEFQTGFDGKIDTALLDNIKQSLLRIAAAHRGVTVEAKPASVALHVRNAGPEDARAALEAARAASAAWPAEMTAGKAVLEFAVITTDKGKAIDIMRARAGADAVVYFGDDVTDEKAFRRIRAGSDVGVKVGPGDTLAQYRVSSPADVAEALALLLRARAATAPPNAR